MSLKEWAQKHKTYLKLEENEPVICRFKGFEEFIDKENDDKDKVRYFLIVGDDEKVLESQSIGLAESMSNIKEGEYISIKRMGQGRNTRYEVKLKPSLEGDDFEKDMDKIADAIDSKEDL